MAVATLLSVFACPQSGIPDFLQETLKVENEEIYEHWGPFAKEIFLSDQEWANGH